MSTTETQEEWETRIAAEAEWVLFSTLIEDPSPLHLTLEASGLAEPPAETATKRRIVWAVLEAVKRLDGENRPLDFVVGSPEFDSVQGAHYRVKGRVTSRRAHVVGRPGETFLTVEEENPAMTIVFPAHKVESVEPVR